MINYWNADTDIEMTLTEIYVWVINTKKPVKDVEIPVADIK